MSEFLTPDPPLCPEAVYHRLLGCELRHQLCLLFLEQLKLQTHMSVLLQFFFQRMEPALGNKEISDQVTCYLSRQVSQCGRISIRMSLPPRGMHNLDF